MNTKQPNLIDISVVTKKPIFLPQTPISPFKQSDEENEDWRRWVPLIVIIAGVTIGITIWYSYRSKQQSNQLEMIESSIKEPLPPPQFEVAHLLEPKANALNQNSFS